MTDLRRANEDKLTKNLALTEISNKKQAMSKINNQLDSNTTSESDVDSYLPSTKVEERIMSSINFLANDSSVLLINITIKDPEQNSTAQGMSAGATMNVNNAVKYADSSVTDPANGTASTINQGGGLKMSEATITISGEYDKIKLFVDSLQHIPIYNSLKSLSISNLPTGSSATSGDQGVNQNNDVQKNSTLYANIVLDFGYMSPAKASVVNADKFNPAIDNETVKALQSYVSKDAVVSGNRTINAVNGGKSNPFLQ